MTLRINSKQISSILQETGAKRYKYFMRVVADQGKVWGLYDDGWALASDHKGVCQIDCVNNRNLSG